MKKLSLFTIGFLLCCSYLNAQSSKLLELPFGVQIGTTKLADIENKATEKYVDENSDSEVKLSMVGGEFDIIVSLNGTVTKIIFNENSNHTLPRSWKNLGIMFGKCRECNDKKGKSYSVVKRANFKESGECIAFGTSMPKFVEIIKKEGAENIEKIGFHEVNFVLDGLLFKTYFENFACGLSSISVSEAY